MDNKKTNNKKIINEKISLLNDLFKFRKINKKIFIVTCSSVYVYNKAVAITAPEQEESYYAVAAAQKKKFKTWSDVVDYLDGVISGFLAGVSND